MVDRDAVTLTMAGFLGADLEPRYSDAASTPTAPTTTLVFIACYLRLGTSSRVMVYSLAYAELIVATVLLDDS